MSKKNSAIDNLIIAVESNDNLRILKAHRVLVVDDLRKTDEPSDRARLYSTLVSLSKEIIKLEGLRENQSSDVIEEMYEDDDLRDNPFGGLT